MLKPGNRARSIGIDRGRKECYAVTMSAIDSYRRGVCAQHYHVNRLRSGRRWIDLRGFDAMFFPASKQAAVVVIAKHTAVLAGMPAARTILGQDGPVLLDGIEYTVTACAGARGIVTEDFYHRFTRKPSFGMFKGMVYLIESADGPLFTTRALDVILSTDAFGEVQGAQFCC